MGIDYGELADKMCANLGEDFVSRAGLDYETMSAGLSSKPVYLEFLINKLSYLERAYDMLGNGIYKSIMSGKVAIADYSDKLYFADEMSRCIGFFNAKAHYAASELINQFWNLSSV